MAKSKLDRLLDKEHPTKEDLEEIVRLIEQKENPTEEELGYLEIAKILLSNETKDNKNDAKSQKQLFKSLLIYLDLSLCDKHGKLNDNGRMALFQITNDYPQFMDDKERRKLITLFMEDLK